jgi:hypothetical protein
MKTPNSRIDNCMFKIDWLQVGLRLPLIEDETIHTYDRLWWQICTAWEWIEHLYPDAVDFIKSNVRIARYKLVYEAVDPYGETILTIAANREDEPVQIRITGNKHDYAIRLLSDVRFLTFEHKSFNDVTVNDDPLHQYINKRYGREVEQFPSMYVQRVDLAFDFMDSSMTFDAAVSLIKSINEKPELPTPFKISTAGDWLTKKDGRTLYFGSRKSDAMIRLYEKSKQLQLHEGEDFHRLEFEFKPNSVSNPIKGWQSIFKEKLYNFFYPKTAEHTTEIFQVSSVSTHVANIFSNLKLAPYVKTMKKETTDIKAVAHMLYQYAARVQGIKEHTPLDLNKMFSDVHDMKQDGAESKDILKYVYDIVNA